VAPRLRLQRAASVAPGGPRADPEARRSAAPRLPSALSRIAASPATSARSPPPTPTCPPGTGPSGGDHL